MGFSGKAQLDNGLELDSKTWVIAGIPLRAPLKPIYTKPVEIETENSKDVVECRYSSTTTTKTPTSEEARISTRLVCPPAPKKRKPSLKCNFSNIEFFNPPDLETVFIRHG